MPSSSPIEPCPESTSGSLYPLQGDEAAARRYIAEHYSESKPEDLLCRKSQADSPDTYHLRLDKIEYQLDLRSKVAAERMLFLQPENSLAQARRELAMAKRTRAQLEEGGAGYSDPYVDWAKHTGWSILAFGFLTHLTTDAATSMALRGPRGRGLIQYFSENEARKRIMLERNLCGDTETLRGLSSSAGDMVTKLAENRRWVLPAALAGVGYGAYRLGRPVIEEWRGESTQEQWEAVLEKALEGAGRQEAAAVTDTCMPNAPLEAMDDAQLLEVRACLTHQRSELDDQLRPIREEIARTNTEIGVLALKELSRDDLHSLSEEELKSWGRQLTAQGLNRPEPPWWQKSGLGDASSIAVGFGIGVTAGHALYRSMVPWDLANRQGLGEISRTAYEAAGRQIDELVRNEKLWLCPPVGKGERVRERSRQPETDSRPVEMRDTSLETARNLALTGAGITLGAALLRFMGKRAAVAAAMSVADGPLPVGEAAGLVLLVGSLVEFAVNAEDIRAEYEGS